MGRREGTWARFNTGWRICSRTWVGLTLIWFVISACPAALPVLPISYQHVQSKAEGGTPKIRVNSLEKYHNQMRSDPGHLTQYPIPNATPNQREIETHPICNRGSVAGTMRPQWNLITSKWNLFQRAPCTTPPPAGGSPCSQSPTTPRRTRTMPNR